MATKQITRNQNARIIKKYLPYAGERWILYCETFDGRHYTHYADYLDLPTAQRVAKSHGWTVVS